MWYSGLILELIPNLHQGEMMLVGVVVVAKIQYELFLLFSSTFTKYSYLKFKRSSLTYHTKNSGGKRRVEIEKCFLWLQPSHLWLFGRVRDALHSTVSWQTLLCVQLPLICGNARADLPPKICAERPQRSELGHTHTRKKKTWKRPWACRPYHADLENRDDKSLL